MVTRELRSRSPSNCIKLLRCLIFNPIWTCRKFICVKTGTLPFQQGNWWLLYTTNVNQRIWGTLFSDKSILASGLSEYGVSPLGLGAHHVPHMVKVGKLMLHFIKIDSNFWSLGKQYRYWAISQCHSAKLGISRLTGGPSKPWGFGLPFSWEKVPAKMSWEQQSSSKLRHSTANWHLFPSLSTNCQAATI